MAVVLLCSSMMRTVSVSILLLFLGFSGSAECSTQRHLLSFKVWKQKKIDEAKSIVAELKHSGHKTQVKSDEEDEEAKQEIAQKVSQADLNLGVARELSANDYFLLYVAPQSRDNNDALVQAAKTLSPRDMADILIAYQKRLQSLDSYSDSSNSSSVTDSNPSTEKTAKAP